MIEVYTKTNCPMCKILKLKLTIKNIDFKEINESEITEEEFEKMKMAGISSFPILKTENEYMTYPQAIKFIDSLEEK